MDISIRQLLENDWETVCSIRLKALQSDSGVFSATYEDAAKRTDADWKAYLTGINTAVFSVFDDGQPIGMTGISIERDDPTYKNAFLWGSWLEPAYRGKGISKLMYAARLKWARQHPTCEKIIVSHRESNIASKFANQKHGFAYTHTEERRWPDSKIENELFYEINIKP